ncbi:hypothetical protein QYF61_001100 [Mycteria americana]|uniref:Uncharacterized protein n=1 Tax=Mycteria americana TaxID=33587 RepID=A0AAN7RJ76_MYCAM|nr:hypothetical protein QYF61_001100 [Mycteria americana]
MALKVHHVEAHMPKHHTTEEHQNNKQVDQAARSEVAQVDLDWESTQVFLRIEGSGGDINMADILYWTTAMNLPSQVLHAYHSGNGHTYHTGQLETYPVNHVTARNTILSFERVEKSTGQQHSPNICMLCFIALQFLNTWGPSHGMQSFTNFSNVGPSHGLQFFKNCSSVGPFQRV